MIPARMRGIDRSPLSAGHLAAVAALLERPLVALDVGCRDGVRASWRALGGHALLVGFDPDPDECARLNALAGDTAHERYEPLALGAQDGERVLHVTEDPQSSSLYPPNERSIERFPELWRHRQRTTEAIRTTTLASWARGAGVEAIDAIKVDVQGAELDVLRGAGAQLHSVRAIEAEVEFQELYRGQPLFADLDGYLRAQGFALWRLRDIAHCALEPALRGEPAFAVGDYVERSRLGGQVAWCNAVWVRDELADAKAAIDWRGRARDACVAALFGLQELVALALREALETAPQPARAALAGALEDVRRRGGSRRMEDLLRRAPAHARGFVSARVARRG